MKKTLLALAVLSGLSLSASAEIERLVEKTFQTQPGRLLKIDTFSGSIVVKNSKESVVKVSLTEKIDASDDAEANEILSKMEFTFAEDADGVRIVAKNDKKKHTGLFGGWKNPVKLSWVLTVPDTYNVDLDTAGGSITVGNLKGTVKADTSGGSIDIGEIEGSVRADTSGGGIKLKSSTGSARLDTSGGSIHVGTVKGALHADTSGGSITVAQAENSVHADTSGGSIEVAFKGQIKGDCSLDTSGGSITVRVDPEAAFRVDADTSAGGVKCEIPITVRGKIERDHLEGDVNGGGHTLKLDTSAGGIRILKR